MSTSINCLVCSQAIEVLPLKSAKTGKYFLQLKCPVDARHIRGFIHDRAFVDSVISNLGVTHTSLDDRANQR